MQTDAKPRVLFVDDDADFLAAMARSLRSREFEVVTASSGKAALDILGKSNRFAVLISDLRMPGMGGVELLGLARRVAPDTSRVLFTGQLDIEHALTAVNEGAIFRFMVKPCATVVVALTIKAAIEQYRLVTAERVLLEQTLRGSIQALVDVLGLASPVTFGRATQLRQTVCALASSMGIAESWHVEIAAMLSQIGYITLPPATLEKVYNGEVLSQEEQAMLSRVPAVAEQILSHIPRFDPVLEILRYSQYRFDGTGAPPGGPAGEQLPWGARVLKVILDLDALERVYESRSLAFDTLLGRKGWYDPAIAHALVEIRKHDPQSEVREVSLKDLVPGMILAKDIRCHNGALYLARGQEITPSGLEKLKNWASELYETAALRVLINCSSMPGERQT
jgi:response regulator RpfG family c-di-GMP phosphodiesterase